MAELAAPRVNRHQLDSNGAGHRVHDDRPDALTAAVADFLERRL